MDVTAGLDAPCPPGVLAPWVDDLARYPAWLTIVDRAEPLPTDDGPAWSVDLTGRLGPLARSKRLRMVRTLADGRTTRFERREADGRSHSPWVLTATLTDAPVGCHLQMDLHYGGALWGPVLEKVLRDEIESAIPRLLALALGD